MRGVRSLLAAAAAAAVLAYGLVGHGVSHVVSHDEMVGAVASFCLLVATVLGVATAASPVAYRARTVRHAASVAGRPAPRAPQDDRARASPAALQRFRN